jgi:hypothetical protein
MKENIKDNAGVPVIHLNGSSKESLIKEWEAFDDALEVVREWFPSESFHPRNHYVKDGDGVGEAEAVRSEMLAHLHALRKIADGILDGIASQIKQ